jgi:hypothetical protein
MNHMYKFVFALTLSVAAWSQRIPASSPIAVRLIEAIDSSKATEGQTYRASVAEAVLVNGKVVVPQGSDASVRLVNLDPSGKFKGSTALSLRLTSVTVGGRVVPVETGDVTRVSGSQGKNTAVKTGIGAGIGAAIGAIAGGGKGAAIGAGAGAAAGAGSQVFTKGQKVQIPSESVLRFLTTKLVRIGAS